MTVNMTSGGIDSDARPTLDLHGVDVENRDGLWPAEKAGSRKSGNVTTPDRVSLSARMQRCLVVEYMVICSELQI